MLDEIAVVQYVLSIFAPQSDRDTGQQGVLCEEEERIVEDEYPEVRSQIDQNIKKTGDDALRRRKLILETGPLQVKENLPDELCQDRKEVHKARSDHWTCFWHFFVQIGKIFNQDGEP